MAIEIKWTDEQESAINYPSDSSACVSAAAGSGKTALLVERVVRLIRGNEAPAGRTWFPPGWFPAHGSLRWLPRWKCFPAGCCFRR